MNNGIVIAYTYELKDYIIRKNMTIWTIMKRMTLLIIFVLLTNFTFSQSVINWASSVGGNSEDKIFAIVQDNINNSYITGSFSQSVEFGDITLESKGETDIFLAKLNPSGKCIWAVSIGGNKSEHGKSIVLDDDGDILLAANYSSDTLNFNDTSFIENSGNQDFLIARFNPFGELIWARGFGYLEYDNISAIDIGNYGNIYITGMFTHHLDFGNNISLQSNGGMDAFVAKLNPNGASTWAKSFGGYSSLEFSNDISCYTDGSAYIIGRYNGSISFPDNIADLSSNGSSDVFLAKFSNAGQCQWARSFGGTASDFGISLDLSNTGMIYTSGYFLGTIFFNINTSLTSIGSTDIFVAKHNPNGSLIWAKKAGSTGSDGVQEISVDNNNEAHLCGYFTGSMVFDANNYINSVSQTDAFFAAYDSLGICQYAESIIGSGSNEATSIFSNDRTVVVGNFTNTINADSFEMESSGSTDIFAVMQSNSYPTLAIPIQISPEKDEIGIATTSTFTWQQISSADEYHLQIATDQNFNNIVREEISSADTLYVVSGLTDNKLYFWRIKAINSIEQSFWSDTRRFVTEQGIPENISLTAPVDSSIWTSAPVLTWEKSEGALYYTLQLSDSEDMSNSLRQFDIIADKQLPIFNLEYGKTYYWRVIAKNGVNSSEWTDTWQFTLQKQYPAAPDLLFPLNDIVSEQEIVFAWEEVNNSNGYHLQVSTSAEFSSIIFNDSTLIGTEKTLLLGKAIYYWRVRAKSENNYGYWQLPRRFSVSAPAIPFASGAGSIYEDVALDICSDSLGNVYTVGYISGMTTFSDDISVNHNGGKDIFISRHNSRGDCLWAKSIGGSALDLATSIIADNSGNIFFAGSYSGSVNFSGQVTLVSNGSEDMFIAKADSSGSIIWAKSIGSIAPDRITGIGSYDYEYIFISGYYSDTLVVNDEIDSLFSNGMNNIFIAKIDTSGNFEWAKGYGSDEFDEANSVAVDAESNAYLAGYFSLSVDFDGFEIGSIGEEDLFVASFNSNGIVRWAESAGSISGSENAMSITVSDDGNSYFTGSFSSSMYFSENDSLVSNGLRDAFVCSYDINGNHRWSFSGGGAGLIDIGNDIELAPDGNLYITGTYAFTSLFGNKAVLKSFGSSDVFVLKVNSDGNILKQKAVGGNYEDFGFGIGVDKFSNVYACGSFKRTAYFNGLDIESFGEEDIFLSMVFGLPATELILPTNEYIDIELSPTFSWQRIANADSYVLQIFEDDNFQRLMESYQLITDTAFQVNNLEPVTDYFWRVRAVSSGIAAPWTALHRFKTKFEVPMLILPENSSYTGDTSVELQWSNINLAENYHLIVSSDQGFNNIIIDINDLENTSYQFDGLEYNSIYFWKVRATNNEYTGEWSEVWEFRTELETPVLLSPINNSTRLNTELVFSWGASSGATSYDIQVSENQDFTTIDFQRINITTNSATIQELSPETRYWWRVKAKTVSNQSQWSSSWTFTTYFSVPSSWDFTENTGSSALIIVPTSANIKLRMRNRMPGDAIGIFYVDDEEIKCAGYGIWNDESLRITVWGDNPATQVKDGFSDNEDFIIRLWDGQIGEEQEAVATYRSGDPDHFVDDETSYVFSIRTAGILVHTIQLDQGWNLISSYILSLDQEFEIIMQPIRSNILLAKNGNGEIYFPSLNINSIGNWNFINGYSIYMTTSDELDITGYPVVPEANPIELSVGWNIISYLRNSAMSIEQAFDEITEDILLVKDNDGNIYFPDLNINSIGQMNPGNGYKVYSFNETSLLYPANSSGRISTNKKQDFSSTMLETGFYNTGNNFSLIVILDGLESASEIVAVNSSGKIVGAGKIIDGKTAISIWGDDLATDNIDGCIEGEKVKLMIVDAKRNELPFNIKSVQSLGDSNSGLNYHTDGATLLTLTGLESSDQISIMPNPSKDEINIRFVFGSDTSYQLQITDNKGRSFISYNPPNPTFEIHERIDVSNLPTGVYYVSIITESKVYSNRFVIVR